MHGMRVQKETEAMFPATFPAAKKSRGGSFAAPRCMKARPLSLLLRSGLRRPLGFLFGCEFLFHLVADGIGIDLIRGHCFLGPDLLFASSLVLAILTDRQPTVRGLLRIDWQKESRT